MNKLIAAAAVLAAVAPAGAALASTVPPDDGYDRTGAETEPAGPVTLTLGWYGGEGRPQALVAARFAEEVDKATSGSVVIDVQYGLGNDSFRMYTEGDLDLLMSPTRSLSTLGVDTFDVLDLPFLVQDDDQADRVAQSAVVDEMMAGFDAIDATGLLLAPVYPIHLAVAGDEPLRTMDQLHDGIRIAPPSGRLEEIYTAMGLTSAYDLNDEDWSNAIADGSVPVSEFPLALSLVVPQPSAMAANWTQYYEFVTILAHNDSLDQFSDDQRAQVMSAAETAAERSISERVREPDAFRDACIEGATLTAMPMPLMANIGRAVDDTILSWLEDPDVKHLYDAVKQAAGAHGWTWPDECRDGTTATYVPPAPPSTEFPFGTYRVEGLTTEQMLVAGVSNDQAVDNDSAYIEAIIDEDSAASTYYDTDGNPEGPPSEVPVHVDAQGYLVSGAGHTYTWRETADGIELEWLFDDVQSPQLMYGEYGDSVIRDAFLVRVH